jgi:hypothetical protein
MVGPDVAPQVTSRPPRLSESHDPLQVSAPCMLGHEPITGFSNLEKLWFNHLNREALMARFDLSDSNGR